MGHQGVGHPEEVRPGGGSGPPPPAPMGNPALPPALPPAQGSRHGDAGSRAGRKPVRMSTRSDLSAVYYARKKIRSPDPAKAGDLSRKTAEEMAIFGGFECASKKKERLPACRHQSPHALQFSQFAVDGHWLRAPGWPFPQPSPPQAGRCSGSSTNCAPPPAALSCLRLSSSVASRAKYGPGGHWPPPSPPPVCVSRQIHVLTATFKGRGSQIHK